ncbi:MAG: glycosyltransferase family 4 protein [Propionivibrio sp.]|nr:glycosyltransferase family 4 protein [Propionivibrio sp.]MBL0209029.1 glycosyltransferase family 4 protein [Propionivibrio sp.]
MLVLVNYMVRSGHTVMAIALSGQTAGGARNLTEEFRNAGATIAILDDVIPGKKHVRGHLFKLVSLIRSWRPDIVHSHLARSDFAVSIGKLLMPKIVWVSTIHDAYVKGVYPGYWIFPWLGWNWRRANHVVAVSGHARDWALRRFGLLESQISTIYHGIKSVPADCVKTADVQNRQPFLVGCLARFEPRKGMATLIRAMVFVRQKVPMVKLVLAGSDPYGYAKELKKLADELDVGSVVDIQGFCDTPMAFLGQLNVFAFASVSEGFGIVLLEAMTLGIPVVASDIYPINHIVLADHTGLLVPPDKPEAFSAAIISLFESPERAQVMGEAGRSRCSEEFSEEKMTRSVHRLYLDQVSRKSQIHQ